MIPFFVAGQSVLYVILIFGCSYGMSVEVFRLCSGAAFGFQDILVHRRHMSQSVKEKGVSPRGLVRAGSAQDILEL